MKKVILSMMFLFLVAFLLLQGFSEADRNVNTKVDLPTDIRSSLEDEKVSEMNVHSMVSFIWEKAYLFLPYTSYKDIEKTIHAKFKGSTNQSTGEYYLLVFLNDDKVVHDLQLPYGLEFSIGEQEYLTPSDDVLRIERQ